MKKFYSVKNIKTGLYLYKDGKRWMKREYLFGTFKEAEAAIELADRINNFEWFETELNTYEGSTWDVLPMLTVAYSV